MVMMLRGKEYGFTACHQIWMDTSNQGIDSYEASERLYKSGIRVNVFNDLPGSNEMMLRIGVNEITRLGAKESEMKELARIFNEAILNKDSYENLQEQVYGLRSRMEKNYGYDCKTTVFKDKMFQLFSCAIED